MIYLMSAFSRCQAKPTVNAERRSYIHQGASRPATHLAPFEQPQSFKLSILLTVCAVGASAVVAEHSFDRRPWVLIGFPMNSHRLIALRWTLGRSSLENAPMRKLLSHHDMR